MSRRAPAYLRYASDSQTPPLHCQPLAVHGAIAVIRDWQWMSDEDAVPIDPAELSRLFRCSIEDIADALPAVLASGIFDLSTPGFLFDPQLRAYKAKVQALSEKRAMAGSVGNEAKKERKKRSEPANATASADANANANLTSTPTPTPTPSRKTNITPSISVEPKVLPIRRFVATGGGA